MLATSVVFGAGFLLCAFIALAFNSDPTKPLLLVSGAFGAVLLFLWLLRPKSQNRFLEGGGFWLWGGRKEDNALNYTPRLIKPRPEDGYGTNKPPTLEELREMRETSANAWVPSNDGRKRRRRR